MAYARRDFEGAAAATTISSGIGTGDTTIAIASSTGWPDASNGSFYAVIDPDLSNEEKVLVAGRTGLSLTTVTRGVDGTSAASHASGATIKHVFTAVDADEANYAVSKTVGKITGAGQILIGDAANSLVALDVKTSGQIVVGNGTTGVSVAVSGDATLASNGALTLANNAVTTGKITDSNVTTAKIANDAVTYAKIQNVSATDRLLGRDTAAAGDVEELTVGGGIEFTGSAGIQRSALTGDVAASAGSGTTAIGTAKVLTAMIANAAVTETQLAASVAGNGLAGGAGTALSVGVDGSSIEISSDALRVKAAGITPAMISVGVAGGTQTGAAGYAAVTADQTGITGAGDTDLTGLTVTFTAAASRRYKVSFAVFMQVESSVPIPELKLKESTTVLWSHSWGNAVIALDNTLFVQHSVIIAPTAAAHTYKLTLGPQSGGNLRIEASATQPSWLLVEDIGTT